MAYQIIVALTSEGTTDVRFLENIVKQAFELVAQECDKDVEIFDVQTLNTTKIGYSKFSEYVIAASKESVGCGATTIAIHSDADKNTYDERKKYNFVPAQNALDTERNETVCKLVTPIIPVRMIEAWMLADTTLLKFEIGTKLSDHELGIDSDPEQMADPKYKIEEAIRIANQKSTHKKHVKNIDISELYETLGQRLETKNLASLKSYQRFLDEIRETFKSLGLKH